MASIVGMVYLISFGMMYLMGTLAAGVFFRKIFIEEWRRRFQVQRGYGYVRINGNDKRQREYFVNLKKQRIKIGPHSYIVDPKKVRFKGNAGVYEYKEGIAEPLDVYDKDLVGTDSEFLQGFLLKMKSLAKVSASKEMQNLLLAAYGAAIAGAIAAVIAFTNYNMLTKMTGG